MKLNTLAQKIGLGYALIVAVLAAAVLLTISQVRELDQTTEQLVDVREPTAQASLQIQGGVNSALAALRGWIIFPEEQFRAARQQAWRQEIKAPLDRLETLSHDWAEPGIVARFEALKPLIDQLETYHDQVEALADTDRENAIRLLHDESIPLAFEIRDVLNQMAAEQRQLLQQEVDDISQRIVFLRNLQWLLLVAGILIGAMLAVITSRAITEPVAHAVSVADRIGQGDLDTPINVGGSRELDTLGTALVNMRDSLSAKTRENERFNWLTTGQNRLNEVMRGDRSVEDLVARIVTFMATYTAASIGSIYLVDDDGDTLFLAGGYAFGGGKVKNRFHKGEGLIGQAAITGKPLSLDNVGDDYIRVSSSLVNAPPRSIYVCPFRFEDSTLGILELGKPGPFDPAQQEFIAVNMDAVGIALSSARARAKIQQLLEETQQQSEELKQQQEELAQTNEELEEQTQQLREQQEELQTANEELEEQTQLILQKNESLETARENIELKARQLEISNKYKSEFLANMSHELRTPLNSLLILANDLANNTQGNLNAEEIESAQVISKSGHDLLQLINDILDLSKVEAGKLDVNVTTIPIAAFANDILRNFRRTAQERGLDLDLSIDPSLPETVRSDRRRLDQILNNLVSNALKFTDEGKVKISLQRAPEGYLAIAVEDTGIGIAKDKLDTVFEAFVQAEGSTSRRYGGTGLGLSISRELARLLDGRITVESTPGRGSTFTLRIPLSIESPLPAAQPPAANYKGKKAAGVPGINRFLNFPSIPDRRDEIDDDDHVILIVEDDDDFAQVLSTQASGKGFKPINAATGEDALRLAAEYLPHAIILDIELPGMDGHIVLKELKSDPELRHIPVHIISATEKTFDPIKSGAVDYLMKPVSKAQLDDAFVRIEGFINRKMKNLLIVEDDDAMRRAIMKLVGNGDVACLEASTADEALKLVRENVVDCMVLDVGLPDMSGFDVIRILEQEHGEKIPPIIIYTGRELSKDENNELQQYAESIIVKGVKSEERLLDETALFLHRTVKNLPEPKKDIISRLYDKEELLRNKRILIVDDDMRNVFALSKVLKDRGMHVVKAENGVTALALLESHPDIDFVLLDIMMPEMDGYDCMREIRRDRKFRDLPIIALTAKAMKDDRQKCIDAGANDYISKPVDVERLISLMRIWARK